MITEVPLPKDIPEISYGSSLMFIGSCFASNVGEKFSAAKFDVSVNPFGVLFNPFSVLDSMDRIVERRYFSESDFSAPKTAHTSVSRCTAISVSPLRPKVRRP